MSNYDMTQDDKWRFKKSNPAHKVIIITHYSTFASMKTTTDCTNLTDFSGYRRDYSGFHRFTHAAV